MVIDVEDVASFTDGDDDTVGWLFGSCVLYAYPFPMPRLSPIPPWPGPIDLKNLLVDDDDVVVVFSSSPRTVHQQTPKGLVLFDHVPRLFIALTGIAFQILPPTAALLSFSSSFSLSSSSLDGHGSKSVGLGGSGFLSVQ